MPESVQATVEVSSSRNSGPLSKVLSPSSVRAPHGEQLSGQLGNRKGGSVALQWVSTVKPAAQNQVSLAPSGKRICWTDWDWVHCDRSSCPCHHVDYEEELCELLPDGKFPLAVWALSCERMGLRSTFPHTGDTFEAQLWLRAILSSMYKLKGQLGGCGGRGPPIRPVQVQLSMGEDVASYAGLEHPQRRPDSQLNACVSWLWTIVNWGEDHDGAVTAFVSLVGSSILKEAPQELEQRALQFTEEVDQKSMPAASWSLIKEMRRQLAVRVHKSTGLLTPDVWRIWLSVYGPGTTLVLLQVHAVGAVRPLVFKVPGVTVQRYVGALMMDIHFMELQCSA